MKNVFLSQFLMISEWKTIVFLIAYLLLAFAVYKLPKKKFSFSSKVLIATVLGLAPVSYTHLIIITNSQEYLEVLECDKDQVKRGETMITLL